MWFAQTYGQPNYAVFEHLFDSSSLVVQGVIVRKNCNINEVGVFSCSYSIKIDSIYKGEILSQDIRPQSLPPGDLSGIRIIGFHRNCFYYLESPNNSNSNPPFKDICYKKNDNIIVFLKRAYQIDPQTSIIHSYFKLTDSWLGIQQANSYMAIDLRNFINFEDLRKRKK